MRYTQYRGLVQVANWVKLKFAAMNLKKLAIWLWREKLFPFISIPLCTLYDRTRPTHNPYTGFLDRLNRRGSLWLFSIKNSLIFVKNKAKRGKGRKNIENR